MAQKPKSKPTNKATFPLMVFIGMCSVMAPPTMIVLACGMVPSIVAIFLSPARAKGALASMVALNLAGVIPVIGFLWERGHTIDQAARLLTDVFMWLIMFGGAGVAGFLLWGVPILVQAAYEVQAVQMIKRLERRRSKLIEEWGGQIIEDAKFPSGQSRIKVTKS